MSETTKVQYTPGPWRHDQDKCAIIADAATDRFGCTPVVVVSLEGAMGGDDSTADARLISAAPDLLCEHEEWASMFGAALIRVLQGDYSEVYRLAQELPIDFPDGAPALRSAAIAKAEGWYHA